MQHRFGHGPAFTVGIEEEFQLVSAESYELVPRFDEVAAAAGDERVRQELMTSVLEVATGVHHRVADAVDEVRAVRRRLRDAAAEHGALIAAAGTHPFSHWEHQEITDSPRYQGVVEELRWVAEQVAIFGLHVHVGMPSPAAAIAVADGLRTHVPELLALSANSPFWQGRDTGLASTRSKIFECSADLDEVARICERGEGASEQRRTQDEAGSLLAVAQWLVRTTVADMN
jgi:glutamate---cysteine ligase / carboxylate-amine ligase